MNKALWLADVGIAYGATPVVQHCDFALEAGEIGALLGASGSGKSTLLKAIAGLLPIQSGEIFLHGQQVAGEHLHLPPQNRDVGMLFQDYALFPHLNALDNVLFGLKHLPKSAAKDKALLMLERVQLADFTKRFPHELSGGQQQRVALARALVRDPSLVLLDEPFSNLDQAVRDHLISDLRTLFKSQNISALLVTHSKQEAFAFADNIALMEKGNILHAASPKVLYDSTESSTLATFLGHIAAVSGQKRGNFVQTVLGDLPAPESAKALLDGAQVVCHLRPHQYDLQTEKEGATVVGVQFLGDVSIYTVQWRSGETLALMSNKRFELGAAVKVGLVR